MSCSFPMNSSLRLNYPSQIKTHVSSALYFSSSLGGEFSNGSAKFNPLGLLPRRRLPLFSPVAIIIVALIHLLYAPPQAVALPPLTIPTDIPDPLKPWVPWVRGQNPSEWCTRVDSTPVCSWPGLLSLTVDSNGGSFTLEGVMERREHVALPGSPRIWPKTVIAITDGRKVVTPPVLEKDGRPAVMLEPGAYRITGKFAWSGMPDLLPVPEATARLLLSRERGPWEVPALTPSRDVVLKRQPPITPLAGDESSELVGGLARVSFARKIEDGIPFRITTRVLVEAPNESQEIQLGAVVLPIGQVVRFSSPLQIRRNPDSSYVVVAPRGTYELFFEQILPRSPEQILLPSGTHPVDAKENRSKLAVEAAEFWVWKEGKLQVVAFEGLSPTISDSPRIPAAWRGNPTFVAEEGKSARIRVIRRGETEPGPSRLELNRRIIVDSRSGKLTFADTITGTPASTSRFTLNAPLTLGSASVSGAPRVISTSGADNLPGIEVRESPLTLEATSQIEESALTIPVNGWSEPMESVQATISLPSGWDLLTSVGATQSDSRLSRIPRNAIVFAIALVLLGAIGAGVQAAIMLALYYLGSLLLFGDRNFWSIGIALATLLLLAQVARRPVSLLPARPVRLALLALPLLGLALEIVPVYLWQLPAVLANKDYLPPALPWRIVTAPDSSESSLPRSRTLGAPPDSRSLESAHPRKAGKLSRSGAAPVLELFAADNESISGAGLDSEAAPAIAGQLSEDSPASQQPSSPQLSIRAPDDFAWGTLVPQTGPGIPEPQGPSYSLTWDRRVSGDETVWFLLLTPARRKLVELLSCLALLGFVLAFKRRWLLLARGLTILLLAIGLAPTQTLADNFPEQSLLQQLRDRLTRDRCQVNCIKLGSLLVRIRGNTLDLVGSVHSDGEWSLALPRPESSAPLLLANITLDSAPYAGLRASSGATTFLRTPDGIHEFALSYHLAAPPASELPSTISILTPTVPGSVTVDAPGWETRGLTPTNSLDGSLVLQKVSTAAQSTAPQISQLTNAWYEVRRSLVIDQEWRSVTSVHRLGDGAPFELFVDLLPREEVLTPGIAVDNGRAYLTFAPGVSAVRWQSRIPPRATLRLLAADIYSENWRISCSPLVRCSFSGVKPSVREVLGGWWHPVPGEKLEVRASPIEGVEGTRATIDSTYLEISADSSGQAINTTLNIRTYESPNLAITIPETATDIALTSATQNIQFPAHTSTIPLTLHPGNNVVKLSWRDDLSPSLRAIRIPSLGLPIPAVNGTFNLNLKERRWVLWTSQSSEGTAVIPWARLLGALFIVFLVRSFTSYNFSTKLLLALASGTLFIPLSLLTPLAAGVLLRILCPNKIDEVQNLGQRLLRGLAIVTIYGTLVTIILVWPPVEAIWPDSNSTLTWYLDRIPSTTPNFLVSTAPVWLFSLLRGIWIILALRLVMTSSSLQLAARTN